MIPYRGKMENWSIGGPGAGNLSLKNFDAYPFPPLSINSGLATPFETQLKVSTLPHYVAQGRKGNVLEPKAEEGFIGGGKGRGRSLRRGRWWVPMIGCRYGDLWKGVGQKLPGGKC